MPRGNRTAGPPPLLPPRRFAGRVAGYWLFALGGLGLTLGLGTWGYHAVADLGWIDAFYNSAMILSGMGPSAEMPDVGSKLFAGGYALFAGLAWTALLSVVLYPFIHRMLHALHLQMREGDDE